MNNPDLKAALPFFQRAQELEVKEPVIAYYCKLHGLQLAVNSGATQSPEAKEYLIQVMNELENEKEMLKDDEIFSNSTAASAHIENFGIRIFDKADREDREGKATKLTAKSFFAASVFLEVLRDFGEVDPAIEEKIKYAKFKTVHIVKALKEGRSPSVGPPKEESPSTNKQQESLQAYAPLAPQGGANEPPVIQPPQEHSRSVSISDAFETDFKSIQDAQKHARFAISSLQYEDVPSAVENLEKALALLRPFLNRK